MRVRCATACVRDVHVTCQLCQSRHYLARFNPGVARHHANRATFWRDHFFLGSPRDRARLARTEQLVFAARSAQHVDALCLIVPDSGTIGTIRDSSGMLKELI